MPPRVTILSAHVTKLHRPPRFTRHHSAQLIGSLRVYVYAPYHYPPALSNHSPIHPPLGRFVSAGDRAAPCLVLFFRDWLLDSTTKFTVASVGVVLMGVATEGLVYLRRHLKKTLLSPAAGGGGGVAPGSWLRGTALPLFLYTAHLTLGYFMMLVRESYLQHIMHRAICSIEHIVLHVLPTACVVFTMHCIHACVLGCLQVIMAYQTQLFVLAVFGLSLGHFIFNIKVMRQSIDPVLVIGPATCRALYAVL